VDHVAVAVHDADAAAANFSTLLGCTVERDELVPAVGVRLLYLASPTAPRGATTLQLVQPVSPGPVADFLDERGEGLHHVCFATDDIAATAARTGGADAPDVFTGGRGLPCAFLLAQPHGARIELTERPTAGRADDEGIEAR
jgi:methylmalonyl-CoA/ethylmalonyl-CoA epimerase